MARLLVAAAAAYRGQKRWGAPPGPKLTRSPNSPSSSHPTPLLPGDPLQEPGNLMNKHSFKYSGLANRKVGPPLLAQCRLPLAHRPLPSQHPSAGRCVRFTWRGHPHSGRRRAGAVPAPVHRRRPRSGCRSQRCPVGDTPCLPGWPRCPETTPTRTARTWPPAADGSTLHGR